MWVAPPRWGTRFGTPETKLWDFAERFVLRCSPRSDNIFPSVFFFGKLIVFCMLFEYFSLDCSTDILQLSTIPDKTSPKIMIFFYFYSEIVRNRSDVIGMPRKRIFTISKQLHNHLFCCQLHWVATLNVHMEYKNVFVISKNQGKYVILHQF